MSQPQLIHFAKVKIIAFFGKYTEKKIINIVLERWITLNTRKYLFMWGLNTPLKLLSENYVGCAFTYRAAIVYVLNLWLFAGELKWAR